MTGTGTGTVGNPFAVNTASNVRQVSLTSTTTVAFVGVYTFTIVIKHASYASPSLTKTFTWTILDPCLSTVLSAADPPNKVYALGSATERSG